MRLSHGGDFAFSVNFGQGSRVRETWKTRHVGCPWHLVADPALVDRRIARWIIESVGIRLEKLRDGGIEKGERAAAIAAETSLTLGETHDFGFALSPYKRTCREKRPSDNRRTAGLATVLAMTERGLKKAGTDFIAHRPAQTTAGMDFFRHRAVVLGDSNALRVAAAAR